MSTQSAVISSTATQTSSVRSTSTQGYFHAEQFYPKHIYPKRICPGLFHAEYGHAKHAYSKLSRAKHVDIQCWFFCCYIHVHRFISQHRHIKCKLSTSSRTSSSATSSTSPAFPPWSCDPSGIVIRQQTSGSSTVQSLSKVNITTGNATLVKQSVGTGATIDAMGYNVLDNYVYAALGTTPGSLLRIASNGDSQTLGSLGLTAAVNTGDVDENGYLWAAAGGKQWWQFDVRPGSATFGQTVASGTAAAPQYPIQDWVYAPNAALASTGQQACCLYALGYDDPLQLGVIKYNTYLQQFNRTSKAWTTLFSYGNLAGTILGGKSVWGATYAADDGFIYSSENTSGELWRFSLGSAKAQKMSTGPFPNNDGARCIKAVGL
ncbi:hypothetical protein PG996_009373 [Apiospora saccharicola]|uniref:DUF6923 domain-containing protein n=1 Tax=Apiospora saccharicola TaxID=335842 RepID=A0ABR1UKK5_9PEZI